MKNYIKIITNTFLFITIIVFFLNFNNLKAKTDDFKEKLQTVKEKFDYKYKSQINIDNNLKLIFLTDNEVENRKKSNVKLKYFYIVNYKLLKIKDKKFKNISVNYNLEKSDIELDIKNKGQNIFDLRYL